MTMLVESDRLPILIHEYMNMCDQVPVEVIKKALYKGYNTYIPSSYDLIDVYQDVDSEMAIRQIIRLCEIYRIFIRIDNTYINKPLKGVW